MRVALVVPVYNSARFVLPLLTAIRSFTEPPDEILFSDDASTDGTIAAVEEHSAGLPISIIRSAVNSGGPGGPINHAVENSAADYYITLDHDDLPSPDRIAVARRTAASAPGAGLFIGRMTKPAGPTGEPVIVDSSLARFHDDRAAEEVAVLSPPSAYAALLHYRSMALSCSQFHFPRWAWEAVGGMDGSIRACIDLAFYEAVARRFPVALVRTPIGTRVDHGDNLSGDLFRRFWDLSEVMQRVHEWYRDLPIPPGGRRALRDELLARAYGFACRGRAADSGRTLAAAVRMYGPHPTAAQFGARCLARLGYDLIRSAKPAGRPAA